MKNNKVVCPSCLGSKTPMTPKKDTGFEYKACTLCEGTGEVSPELEEDFILSLNESSLEEDNLKPKKWIIPNDK